MRTSWILIITRSAASARIIFTVVNNHPFLLTVHNKRRVCAREKKRMYATHVQQMYENHKVNCDLSACVLCLTYIIHAVAA